ncbi:MAG: transglutaminase-like domain-containing protein [bacterium]|nr:transglutaminase-like domain-containing protein [bacterium]
MKGLRSICIIGFWIIIMTLLFIKEGVIPVKSRTLDYKEFLLKEIPYGEEWMGIYFDKKKIGYAQTSINPHSRGFIISNRARLFLSMLSQDIEVDIDGYSIIDKEYKLRSFSFNLLSSFHKMRIKGVRKEDRLFLSIRTGGEEIKRCIPFQEDCFLEDLITPFRRFPQLSYGKEYTVNIIDPLSLSTGTATLRVIKRERITFKDEVKDVMVVEVDYKDISIKSWVTDEGEVLRCETPLGLIMVKETELEQREFEHQVGSQRFDLIKAVSVPSNIIIKSPKKTTFLKAKVLGVDLSRYKIADSRQKVFRNTIEISTSSFPATSSLSLPIFSHKEFLKSTPFIQCKNERIIEMSKKIVNQEKNAYLAVKRLLNWISRNIEKGPTISIPSALEVLRKRTGDCNEISCLFTALSRASGIPTKICVGLVYHGDAFYYHAWCKVFVGKWLDIDPTFNQMMCDATHIKFAEGDDVIQTEIIGLIGKLRIEILDYKTEI